MWCEGWAEELILEKARISGSADCKPPSPVAQQVDV